MTGRKCEPGCTCGRHKPAWSTHSYTHHPHYGRWYQMMRRCYTVTDIRYLSYGGRGIIVCESWHNVIEFCDWIDANLGPRPDKHTLDRIDNNGNYEPGNMRWATHSTQMLNRRPEPGKGRKFSKEHRQKISDATTKQHETRRAKQAAERRAEVQTWLDESFSQV